MLLSVPSMLLLVSVLLPAQAPAEQPQQTALIIPHTHWEGAVFKTREEYLEIAG